VEDPGWRCYFNGGGFDNLLYIQSYDSCSYDNKVYHGFTRAIFCDKFTFFNRPISNISNVISDYKKFYEELGDLETSVCSVYTDKFRVRNLTFYFFGYLYFFVYQKYPITHIIHWYFRRPFLNLGLVNNQTPANHSNIPK
jgi:hypothetical protein